MKLIRLSESPSEHGGRLGRHVEHDPRSRAFGVVPREGTLQPVSHKRHGGILDQGNLGSCTGNAMVGAANTEPTNRPLHVYRERKAVQLYSRATQLDGFDGAYPPTDTGSSGLAVCKAAKEAGLITSYQHAFGIDQALAALQERPVITGVGWFEGFDRPDGQGIVQIEGQERGGHEFEVCEYIPSYEPLESLVGAINSWGAGWGIHGRFFFTVRTWAALLERDGDVTVPIR